MNYHNLKPKCPWCNGTGLDLIWFEMCEHRFGTGEVVVI